MFASIAALGVSAGLIVSLTRMWRGSSDSSHSTDTPTHAGFSPERYRVMERLFSSRDLEFLSAQPGYTPEMAANWKRESINVFRIYLDELTADFHSLHAAARQMVAASHAESPELAALLVRQSVAFFQARLLLEWRVLLFRLGASQVDVASIVDLVKSMQVDLSRLVPETIF
jgi:hypothetical protein